MDLNYFKDKIFELINETNSIDINALILMTGTIHLLYHFMTEAPLNWNADRSAS